MIKYGLLASLLSLSVIAIETTTPSSSSFPWDRRTSDAYDRSQNNNTDDSTNSSTTRVGCFLVYTNTLNSQSRPK